MFFLEGDGEGGTYARALHVVFGGKFVSGGGVFTPNLERFGSYWVGCYWVLDAIGCWMLLGVFTTLGSVVPQTFPIKLDDFPYYFWGK